MKRKRGGPSVPPQPPKIRDALVEAILSKVAAHTIRRFRCLSKAWKGKFSDRGGKLITKRVFEYPEADESSIKVLVMWKPFPNRLPSPWDYALRSYANIDRPQRGPWPLPCGTDRVQKTVKIVGGCNGIFCVVQSTQNTTDPLRFFLFNPSFPEQVRVVEHRIAVSGSSRRKMGFGFGFSSARQDFKIVICHSGEKICQLYSVKRNRWETIEGPTESLYSVVYHWHPHDGKNCFWYGIARSGEHTALLSFDMSTDTFEPTVTVANPIETTKEKLRLELVSNVKGYIVATFTNDHRQTLSEKLPGRLQHLLHVWVLLKYGDSRSWVKLFAFRMEPSLNKSAPTYIVPMGFYREGRCILAEGHKQQVYAYDRDKNGCLYILQLADYAIRGSISAAQVHTYHLSLNSVEDISNVSFKSSLY